MMKYLVFLLIILFPFVLTAQGKTPVTPNAQIKWAEKNLKELESSRQIIQNDLVVAQSEKDVQKVTCLNDKLSQANATIKSFARQFRDFRKSLLYDSFLQQKDEFSILISLVDRQKTILKEAKLCVGEDELYTGKTEVTKEIDDNITGNDPTGNLEPDVCVDARPPEASGSR